MRPSYLHVHRPEPRSLPSCAWSHPWTAQVAGDYAIGSNHVLPTAGAARARGGLSAADFVRQVTVQRVTRAGLGRIGDTVMTLATAEGLVGHATSIRIRLKGQTTPSKQQPPRSKSPTARGRAT